ncbi:cobalamin biosynthesis protein [Frigidibacter sp. MR17.14]|uniref:cobalamin biosynthesis protein n=1 Tax=Frigidibacter sp. MR17.14 TaxID=3126509 RepID=UPI003012B326
MIVAGIGFTSRATAASVASALAATGGAPTRLATAAAKAEVLKTLVSTLNLPVSSIPPEDLAAQTTLTHSEASSKSYKTGSVAEAAALAAAGPGARLLGPRVISDDRQATAALAVSAGEDP